jgi:polar amino acid transport system substrate-binding protein
MRQQNLLFLTFRNNLPWLPRIATGLLLAGQAVAATPLTVVTEEFAPYSFSAGGKISGYSTEVVRAALDNTHLDYKLQILPWARAFLLAKTQPNVLIYNLVRTPEREARFHWIAQLAPRNVYLYKLAARRDIRISSLVDLRPYRIAANRGDVVEEQLHQLGLLADLGVQDETSLKKLVAGRVDLMVATELSIQGVCVRAAISCALLERSIAMPGVSDYYAAASLGTPPATLQVLRAGFAKLKNSDFMQRTADKYRLPLK